MPARNAQSLVDYTRQLVGVFDNTRLRDGFDDDLGEADNAILGHLNTYYRSLIPTGFVKCWFTLNLTQNIATYTFDGTMGSIEAALYFDTVNSGLPLEKTQLSSLLGEYPGYGQGSQYYGYGPVNIPPSLSLWAVPRKWYADPPRTFNLFPLPTASGAYVQLLAETEPSDLVLPTDVPIDLFNGLHDELCHGAAIRCCIGLGLPDLLAKIPYLAPMAKRLEDYVQQIAQHRGLQETRQVRPGVWRRGRSY